MFNPIRNLLSTKRTSPRTKRYLKPKNEMTTSALNNSDEQTLLKYSVTLKSRFDFRRFPFETQILHFSIKTCSISDGIQFANGHHHARKFKSVS